MSGRVPVVSREVAQAGDSLVQLSFEKGKGKACTQAGIEPRPSRQHMQAGRRGFIVKKRAS